MANDDQDYDQDPDDCDVNVIDKLEGGSSRDRAPSANNCGNYVDNVDLYRSSKKYGGSSGACSAANKHTIPDPNESEDQIVYPRTILYPKYKCSQMQCEEIQRLCSNRHNDDYDNFQGYNNNNYRNTQNQVASSIKPSNTYPIIKDLNKLRSMSLPSMATAEGGELGNKNDGTRNDESNDPKYDDGDDNPGGGYSNREQYNTDYQSVYNQNEQYNHSSMQRYYGNLHNGGKNINNHSNSNTNEMCSDDGKNLAADMAQYHGQQSSSRSSTNKITSNNQLMSPNSPPSKSGSKFVLKPIIRNHTPRITPPPQFQQQTESVTNDTDSKDEEDEDDEDPNSQDNKYVANKVEVRTNGNGKQMKTVINISKSPSSSSASDAQKPPKGSRVLSVSRSSSTATSQSVSSSHCQQRRLLAKIGQNCDSLSATATTTTTSSKSASRASISYAQNGNIRSRANIVVKPVTNCDQVCNTSSTKSTSGSYIYVTATPSNDSKQQALPPRQSSSALNLKQTSSNSSLANGNGDIGQRRASTSYSSRSSLSNNSPFNNIPVLSFPKVAALEAENSSSQEDKANSSKSKSGKEKMIFSPMSQSSNGESSESTSTTTSTTTSITASSSSDAKRNNKSSSTNNKSSNSGNNNRIHVLNDTSSRGTSRFGRTSPDQVNNNQTTLIGVSASITPPTTPPPLVEIVSNRRKRFYAN